MMTNLLKRTFFLTLFLTVSCGVLAEPAKSQNPFTAADAAKPTSVFDKNTPRPAQPVMIATPPNIDAKGYILMDAYSGKIIASKNPDQRMAPASLTKMMTSYIVSAALDAKRIHLDDLVPISKEAWQTGGSKMFVKVGDQVPVRLLMQGMIVDSGNDACVALAEFVAGSQDSFVNLMNQQAALLGMKNSHFMDVNGLPDAGHYTTPRDMATLARALVFDFPNDYQWYSQKWFTYNNIRQPNRNRLLWSDPTVDGIKTGHTDDAGYCLVASAKRKDTRLISVVMGTPSDQSRAADSAQLLTYGFRFYGSHKLYAAKTPLARAQVMLGQSDRVTVGPKNDIYITLPVGQDAAVKTDLALKDPIKAPIKAGDVVGTVRITLHDEQIAEAPVIALADVGKGSWWQQILDHMDLMIKKII